MKRSCCKFATTASAFRKKTSASRLPSGSVACANAHDNSAVTSQSPPSRDRAQRSSSRSRMRNTRTDLPALERKIARLPCFDTQVVDDVLDTFGRHRELLRTIAQHIRIDVAAQRHGRVLGIDIDLQRFKPRLGEYGCLHLGRD